MAARRISQENLQRQLAAVGISRLTPPWAGPEPREHGLRCHLRMSNQESEQSEHRMQNTIESSELYRKLTKGRLGIARSPALALPAVFFQCDILTNLLL